MFVSALWTVKNSLVSVFVSHFCSNTMTSQGLLRPLILPLTLPFSVNIHVTDDFVIQERKVYVHMMDGALKRP